VAKKGVGSNKTPKMKAVSSLLNKAYTVNAKIATK
jgi:hypothetical protein